MKPVTDKELALLEYKNLIFNRTVDSELGKYNPEKFHTEKHRITNNLLDLKISFEKRNEARNQAKEQAYKYLDNDEKNGY